MSSENPNFPAAWAGFLEHRAQLIHIWHADGRSDEFIANQLSCDAAQVQRIRVATTACDELQPYYRAYCDANGHTGPQQGKGWEYVNWISDAWANFRSQNGLGLMRYSEAERVRFEAWLPSYVEAWRKEYGR